MWRLEQDESYYRILDSRRQIAGYFDPEYGQIEPQEKAEEIIEQMIRRRDPIAAGYLTFPMTKFGIFDTDYQEQISALERQIDGVQQQIKAWKRFLDSVHDRHVVRISHTSQDMLSVTFPVRFDSAIRLDKKEILESIRPVLDRLHESGLL